MSQVCEHIGNTPPSQFSCSDCDDTADKCNCHECMGVFCDQCRDLVSLDENDTIRSANCQDVVDMWDETQQGFDDEKKDCLNYNTCKKYDETKEPLHCDACGHYMTTGMY